MSERDPEGLPPMDEASRDLLASGGGLLDVREDARTRLRSRVLTSIGAGGGGGGGSSDAGKSEPPKAASGASGAGGTGGAARAAGLGLSTASLVGMGATFVLGAALGFGLRPLVESGTPAHAVSSAPLPIPERTVAARVLVSASAEAAPVASAAPSAAPSASARPAPVRDLAAERGLLDGARAALGRGDPGAAIILARTHEQRFPRGALSEERDALWVQALAQAGKTAEARARAAKFEQNYPGSMLLPAVLAAAPQKGAP